MRSPLVSVVIPFHNTEEFLAESIESVISQTYQNWELVLVDNCSSDRSGSIAASYASKYPSKIRLILTKELLPQVRNYNFALSLIAHESEYCKVVQADDWIYPECLERMVGVAESYPTIGIVSSYRLKGEQVMGGGLPYSISMIEGREICRMHLTSGIFLFGSPTTLMYRADIVRRNSPLYDETVLHDDTDTCYRILSNEDFGFVHQVLSFSRVGNSSIMTRAANFGPEYIDKLLQLSKFGNVFLSPERIASELKSWKKEYYRFLAHRLLEGFGKEFWQYHMTGLRSGGIQLDRMYLAGQVARELVWMALCPGLLVWSILRRLRK